jgi:hypothetical protein
MPEIVVNNAQNTTARAGARDIGGTPAVGGKVDHISTPAWGSRLSGTSAAPGMPFLTIVVI